MNKTRNSEVLADFVAYCEANSTQRFWQALCNWSGASHILASEIVSPMEVRKIKEIHDTWHWEHRNS